MTNDPTLQSIGGYAVGLTEGLLEGGFATLLAVTNPVQTSLDFGATLVNIALHPVQTYLAVQSSINHARDVILNANNPYESGRSIGKLFGGIEVLLATNAVVKSASVANIPTRGVTFFGEDALKYYTSNNATLGGRGTQLWFMPAEDAAKIRSVAQAAKETGYARSVKNAYLKGGDVYGIEFPVNKGTARIPTINDAGSPLYPHYLSGGNTAVRGPDSFNSFYLINKTREFVSSGGFAVPKGSVLFKLGRNGERIIIRRWE